MKLTDYKAGSYRQEKSGYRSFQPSTINHAWHWDDPDITDLLSRADRRLGELNGLSLIVPDLDRFIRMHVVKEAQTSSRIEGTVTGMKEAAQEDPKQIDPERRNDWQEVRNYIAAMNQAMETLRDLPLSNRLLRGAHKTLLSHGRGESKMPGDFRRSQNWIGGATLNDAVFIPPHHDTIGELLTDMEAFWHNDRIKVPDLIRIAITHYQFETIHPFLDGNGRIGRLLITLYLVSKGILSQPCLYLSAHLEKHRSTYYDSLMRVRTTHDLGHWLRFFLVAVIETSDSAINTFRATFTLQETVRNKLTTLGRATPNATRIVDKLYGNPWTNTESLSQQLDLSVTTCNRLIHSLVELGILMEVTGNQRNRIFVFADYVRLFQ